MSLASRPRTPMAFRRVLPRDTWQPKSANASRVAEEGHTLTIIATEGYEEFAEGLQKEIERDTGITFGFVENHQFASIVITRKDGSLARLGAEDSSEVFEYLREQGYIDANGAVQAKLRLALQSGTFAVPDAVEEYFAPIRDLLRKIAGKLDIKNADERIAIKLREAVFESEEFRELWERIRYKTTYRLGFDNDHLIAQCIKAIEDAPPVSNARVRVRKADISLSRGGVGASERAVNSASFIVVDQGELELPDILTDLQDRTHLTRKSIAHILVASGRLKDFRRNPQAFIELCSEAINRVKKRVLIDGISYRLADADSYYERELFAREELTGYLRNTFKSSAKCLFEQVLFDPGSVEKAFAKELEQNVAVKVYTKLPSWFKVSTPLGTYNPDWAVLVEEAGELRTFFVVETKSSLFEDDRRVDENAKIACAREHFSALVVDENPARYILARNVEDVMTQCFAER
jgi:type III restriction enzyme